MLRLTFDIWPYRLEADSLLLLVEGLHHHPHPHPIKCLNNGSGWDSSSSLLRWWFVFLREPLFLMLLGTSINYFVRNPSVCPVLSLENWAYLYVIISLCGLSVYDLLKGILQALKSQLTGLNCKNLHGRSESLSLHWQELIVKISIYRSISLKSLLAGLKRWNLQRARLKR